MMGTNFSNRDIYYISDMSMNMFRFMVGHYMPYNMKNDIWVNCVVSLAVAGRL